MAFTSFTSIDQLLEKYGLTQRREPFVQPTPGRAFSTAAREQIAFSLDAYSYERSEIAARETLIFPILQDVWRHYRDHLTMLSGEPVEADADLRGEVDYVVCRRSPHGPYSPDQPYLLVGEAKRDDATVGWNQALGGMIAAQQLGGPEFTYFGLTTTGTIWRVGRLVGRVFTRDTRPFTIGELDDLAGALHFVFAACRDQVLSQPPAAP